MTDITTRPVTGWTFHSIANSAILLGLQTVGSEQQLAAVMSGRSEADNLPALLTPAQCLELSDALRRHAQAILGQTTPPRSHQS